MKKSWVRVPNERCTCGSSGYCDTYTNRMVECKDAGAGKCQIYDTSESC
jgi:hypothetical protein